jgi:hypothetical protein
MLDQHVHSSVEVEILDPDSFDVLGADAILPVCQNCEKLKTAINSLRAEVGYWKSRHQRAL